MNRSGRFERALLLAYNSKWCTRLSPSSHTGITVVKMHEFSITQSILSIAVEKASEANASKITQINVVIGEISGIVSDCVNFYFDFLSKDTIAAEASLNFTRVPFKLHCRNCDTTFTPENYNWTCPNCQEHQSEVASGGECYLESIEIT